MRFPGRLRKIVLIITTVDYHVKRVNFKADHPSAESIPTRDPGRAAPSAGTRYYVVALLTLVGTANFLDRQVLSILLEPIRHDLSLNDTQVGFLGAVAFTFIYVTLAIPAARLADRWSRRKVIALAVSFWSLMTMACGFANTFVQLISARFGVGVGESAGSAPSQAFVGDLIPRERRATAMAFLLLSTPLGIALGFLWGGWALGRFGWREAFIVAGIPGLILGPLVLFTLPEIPKGMSDGIRKPLHQVPLLATIRLLWTTASFRNMIFAATLQTFLTLGMSTWVPSFLVRSYGLSPRLIGAGLAIAYGSGVGIGSLAGGRLMDVLGRRDLRWHFWTPTIAVLLSSSLAACAFVAPPRYVFLFMGLQVMFGALFASPMVAITQILAPVAARATASACALFVINTIALGLGPQAVGITSDLLRSTFGENSLRIALLGACGIGLPAAVFFYRASVTYRSDVAAAERRIAAESGAA